MKTRPYDELKTVARAIDLLKAFSRADEWSVSALARDLELHKSVTHRLLVTMTRAGLLTRDPDTERYSLGMLVATLGHRAERRSSLARVARPHLLELAERCQETVSLSVVSGTSGLIVDSIDSRQSMRFTVHPGETFLLHAGCVGKVLLAYQPTDVLDQVFAVSPLPRYTDKTLTAPAALRRELTRIRAAGVGFSDGEITPGARSVGAAVWNHEGRVAACVSISAPAVRLAGPAIGRFNQMVMATAERISRALGYGGAYPGPVSPVPVARVSVAPILLKGNPRRVPPSRVPPSPPERSPSDAAQP
jgi:DNA-binding IclR family transcriptional regulator